MSADRPVLMDSAEYTAIMNDVRRRLGPWLTARPSAPPPLPADPADGDPWRHGGWDR